MNRRQSARQYLCQAGTTFFRLNRLQRSERGVRMSDDQNDSGRSGAKRLVKITSDNMQALNTHGTNEIVPPDSPKKGHLFLLSTTVASDGEMEIQRTLVEEGENNDFDENSEITGPVSVQPSNENRQLDDQHEDEQGHLHSVDERNSEILESQPLNEDPKSKVATEQINSVEDSKAVVQEPIEVHASDVQESSPQNANLYQNINEMHQAVVNKDEVETVEASPAKKDGESKVEPTEQCKPDVPVASEAVEANKPPEIADATASEILQMEQAGVKPVKEEGKDRNTERKSKPKRTMTLPAGGRFALPWQKKHVEDDSTMAKSSTPVKMEQKPDSIASTAATTTATTSAPVITNPLSGVVKSIKKGFKIKVGGSSKSSEDSAPGRIPQKSGVRPSPRIVSSLSITPTHQPEVAAEPVSWDIVL